MLLLQKSPMVNKIHVGGTLCDRGKLYVTEKEQEISELILIDGCTVRQLKEVLLLVERRVGQAPQLIIYQVPNQ